MIPNIGQGIVKQAISYTAGAEYDYVQLLWKKIANITKETWNSHTLFISDPNSEALS